MNLNEKIKAVIKDAAQKLTGPKRRAFEAKVATDLFDGNVRKVEQELGWGRETVRKGIKESEIGITCRDNYKGRGNKRTEKKLVNLEQDIRDIIEPHSQVDPKFQTALVYTRITAEAVRNALINNKGYKDEELPTARTVLNIINRLGFTLKKVRKSKPLKKTAETDEIFGNVRRANSESDSSPESLRISVDTKAGVKIGELSRGGKCRCAEAPKAHDHDTEWNGRLKPVGILDAAGGLLTLIFSNSAETSDLIMDALLIWWNTNKKLYSHIGELVINMDNGPHNGSHRTQFIKRMIEFSDITGLSVRLVYYPPCRSKYNPVERRWGILENHWNGTILNSIEKALGWAATMTWKGTAPVVEFMDKVYEKGIKLTKKEMEKYNERLNRSADLPKYDVRIEPQFG